MRQPNDSGGDQSDDSVGWVTAIVSKPSVTGVGALSPPCYCATPRSRRINGKPVFRTALIPVHVQKCISRSLSLSLSPSLSTTCSPSTSPSSPREDLLRQSQTHRCSEVQVSRTIQILLESLIRLCDHHIIVGDIPM